MRSEAPPGWEGRRPSCRQTRLSWEVREGRWIGLGDFGTEGRKAPGWHRWGGKERGPVTCATRHDAHHVPPSCFAVEALQMKAHARRDPQPKDKQETPTARPPDRTSQPRRPRTLKSSRVGTHVRVCTSASGDAVLRALECTRAHGHEPSGCYHRILSFAPPS